MDVLVIEDDNFKSNSITTYFMSKDSSNQLTYAESLVDAIDRVNEKKFDLIIVDMSIPSHPIEVGGGSPTSLLSGGIEILLKLSFKKRMDPCIVLTQYPDIKISGDFYDLEDASAMLNEKFKCNVISCVEYKEDSAIWQKELDTLLEGL